MIPAYESASSVLNFVLLEWLYGLEYEYYYIETLSKAAYIIFFFKSVMTIFQKH